MRTRTLRDRSIACGVVLGWHGALAWVLLRGLQLHQAGEGDTRMLATFIEVAAMAQPAPKPVPHATHRHPGAPPRDPARAAMRVVAIAPSPAMPMTSAIAPVVDPAPLQLQEQLQVQTHAAARAGAPITFAPRDPFADRTVRLPGTGEQHFRMPPSVSPLARVVAIVGMFTGGVDARTVRIQRCARIHENLATLATAGEDSTALRDALDNDRHYCSP